MDADCSERAVSGASAEARGADGGVPSCAWGSVRGGGVCVSVRGAVYVGGVLGERACEPWYCVLDVLVQGVEGSGYRHRVWTEQGFGQWRRGGWGWHWMRVEGSERVFLAWLV